MKIRITKENEEKINEAIAQVETRCKSRLCTYTECEELVQTLLELFQQYGIAKKYRTGSRAWFSESVDCNSYKYNYQSTEILIEATSTGFFLVGVERVEKYTKAREVNICFSELTQNRAKEIFSNSIEKYSKW